MKIKGYTIVYGIVLFFYGLTILATVIAIFFSAKRLVSEDAANYVLHWRPAIVVNIDDSDLKVVSENAMFESPMVGTREVLLNFNSKSVWPKVITLIGIILFQCYLIVGMHTLKNFVRSVKTDSPFIAQNVKRLRIIGVLLLLVEPIQWLLAKLMWFFIDQNFLLYPERKSTISISTVIFSHWLLGGLLILLIAQIFNYGIKIKEEQDLTV